MGPHSMPVVAGAERCSLGPRDTYGHLVDALEIIWLPGMELSHYTAVTLRNIGEPPTPNQTSVYMVRAPSRCSLSVP